MSKNFVFYDYETFGMNPALDKPAQFASVRTNKNFKIIESPTVIYCRPSEDYYPDPESVIITGITPQYACKRGVKESVFSKVVFSAFNKKNSCIVGFNNIQFDDEFTRNIFYRNLLDPYSWHWKNGNCRLDVIKIIVAYYVLCPKGINWPKKSDGSVSFKLEDLARENRIQHDSSHDALSDVYATIGLIKLLKKNYPIILNFFLTYGMKSSLLSLLKKSKNKVFIYISRFFGFKQKYFCCCIPIVLNPKNNNIVVFINIGMQDLEVFFSKNKKNIKKVSNLKVFFSFGFIFFYLNKCDVLVPMQELQRLDVNRLILDEKIILKNRIWVKKNYFFLRRVVLTFINFYTFQVYEKKNNVDLNLYQSFLSDHDKQISKKIHTLKKNMWKLCRFHDVRLDEVFYRYRARNYFETLNDIEKRKWFDYCYSVVNKSSFFLYVLRVKNLFKVYRNKHGIASLLKQVLRYIRIISIKHYINFIFKKIK